MLERCEGWRALMHAWKMECDAAVFSWLMCSFVPPSRALIVYHPERGAMPLPDGVNLSTLDALYMRYGMTVG